MKLVICSIRDSAMDAFQRPMCFPTVGMAVRAFGDACISKESGMSGHLEDYAIFELGTFDEVTGLCENLPSPRQLARGVDYKEIVREG